MHGIEEQSHIYRKILEHHRIQKYDSPYLAYDGKDTILVRSLDRTLRRLCLLCDVDYFNSHAIRKTFATMLHFNGVPTSVISDLMGHSEIGTTEKICGGLMRLSSPTKADSYCMV